MQPMIIGLTVRVTVGSSVEMSKQNYTCSYYIEVQEIQVVLF